MKNNQGKWKKFKGSEDEWNSLVFNFNGNYRQTFKWGEYQKENGWEIIRYQFEETETAEIKFIVQLMVKKFLFLRAIYVPGGVNGNFGGYSNALRDLIKSEFKFYLIYVRLDSSYEYDEEIELMFFKDNWFRPKYSMNSRESLYFDLQEDTLDIMPNKSKGWERQLSRAKKRNTKIIFGKGEFLEDEIKSVSQKMQQIKHIYLRDDPNQVIKIMNFFKNSIIFIYAVDNNGKMIGFRSCLFMNNYAWDFYASSNNIGRKLEVGYLLLYELVKECKKRGIKKFILPLPKNNIGDVEFKKRTGAEYYQYIGEWEYTNFKIMRYVLNSCIYLMYNFTIFVKLKKG